MNQKGEGWRTGPAWQGQGPWVWSVVLAWPWLADWLPAGCVVVLCVPHSQEFASGGSLVKHIYGHEGHKLPETEAHRLFTQMASALDYCHRRWVLQGI